MPLTTQEIADCRTDLLTFSKFVFRDVKGYDFIENWHHIEMCNELEKVFIGETKRLIVNMPPRLSKTELCFVMFVAWSWGNCPDSKYLHVTHAVSLAQENMINLKQVLDCDVYRQIFPDFSLSKESQTDLKTSEGGTVYGAGTGGGLIGKGAGAINNQDGMFHGCAILDDLIKAEEAYSDTVREKTNTWINRSFMSRLNSRRDTPVILVMQRLHINDPTSFLLKGGTGEDWKLIKFPLLNEVTNKPLWPLKYTNEEIAELKNADDFTFFAQYQQNPSVEGGGIFKDKYWNYYKGLPVIVSKRIYADTALKTKEHNDYSVFQCWGKSQAGQIYLLDQLRGKWEAPELEMNAKAFYNKHNTGYSHVNAFKIEDKASGIGLIQSLKRTGLPIVPIERNVDKVTRAHDSVGLLASGNVYLPEEWDGLSDYLSEFSSFPNATHDDQVDPTMDAIEDFLRNEPIDYGAMF